MPSASIGFHQVTVRRVFEDVIRQITDAIQAGELTIGDRLPSERDMAEMMDVSRPTVRAALRLLQECSVVGSHPGRKGTFVVNDSIPEGAFPNPSEMQDAQVWDVLQYRRLLEVPIACLAAVRASDHDFEVMEATIQAQEGLRTERSRFLQHDHRFHLAMARATKNELVVDAMRSLLRKLARAYDLVYRQPGEPQVSIDLHRETLAALMTRDHASVTTAMDHHLSVLERIWQEDSGRAPPTGYLVQHT